MQAQCRFGFSEDGVAHFEHYSVTSTPQPTPQPTPRDLYVQVYTFSLVDLRILVMLLLDTLPMLGNVLLICFFVFFIFGILGVQLWAGLLRQRCFMPGNMTGLIQQTADLYNM